MQIFHHFQFTPSCLKDKQWTSYHKVFHQCNKHTQIRTLHTDNSGQNAIQQAEK